MSNKNLNYQSIMNNLISCSLSGYYHGKWNQTFDKFKIRCPYCQHDKTGKKKFKSSDHKAALLPKMIGAYEVWTFHCLKCKTTKRIDYLVKDHPDLIAPNSSPLKTAIPASVAPAQQHQPPKNASVKKNGITQCRTLSPQEQAGHGGYLNSLVAQRKSERKGIDLLDFME